MSTARGSDTHEVTAASPAPAEVYGPPSAPIKLLVGNGGAGAVGLIRALAEAFLHEHREPEPYAVGWVKAGSGESLELVREGRVDMALTYEPVAERRLVREGVATAHHLVFHDRFILAGPAADPAGLAGAPADIGDAFLRLAELGARPGSGVRFLSRDNTSATTVKERLIWDAIQRRPWEEPESPWYLRFDSFPIEALARADAIGAYTLNDRGTWIATPEARARLAIFRSEGAILDNPCSVIVTTPRGGSPAPLALSFAEYLISPPAQRLIAMFGEGRYGEPLYRPRDPAAR